MQFIFFGSIVFVFSANIFYYVIKYLDLVTSRVETPFQEVSLKLLRVIKTVKEVTVSFL